MVRRIAPLVLAGTLLLALMLPAASSAVYPNPNPWLKHRFLNIAHQGGEDEAPSNTMFAFKSAIADRGADMLELDVNLSLDNELMVIHDDTVSRTTNGPSTRATGSEVNDMTVAQLQALDAGHWFRPNSYSHDPAIPESEFTYRGVRTGSKPPPAGYTAEDFKIPTLREVLDAFPNTPINIEIKMVKVVGGESGGCQTQGGMSYCDSAMASQPVAEALANLLDEPQYSGRSNNFIVVSFSDDLVAHFRASENPPYVPLAPGLNDAFLYGAAGNVPDPDVAAFQVPPVYSGLNAPKFLLDPNPVRDGAHEEGYAVHVWANGNEGEAEYGEMLKLGVDGYMASEPGRLHKFLCANEVPRPNGDDRCPTPKKKCKRKPKSERRSGLTVHKKKGAKPKCKRKKKRKK